MTIPKAIEYVKRVRGGSQAHILGADDGHHYVVKLLNTPQGDRVLANDLLATRLARIIGLPVPEPIIIEVDAAFIERTPDLCFQLAGRTLQPAPGLQFGSRLIANDYVMDFLPDCLTTIENARAFAGILAFDKWTCQADGRQAVFHHSARQRNWRATFIDFGYAFNATDWQFPDSPLRGVYALNNVYRHVANWNAFEPWLSRIEHFSARDMYNAAEDIPPAWYGERHELDALLERLIQRRGRVRDLITSFRHSTRTPFPCWTAPAVAEGAAFVAA
jgi:hypothetical protein